MPEPSAVPNSETIVTPIPEAAGSFELRAFLTEGPIAIELIQSSFSESEVIGVAPLICKIVGNGFVVVLPFGTIVFWQPCDAQLAKVNEASRVRVLRLMQDSKAAAGTISEAKDELVVLTNQPHDAVRFRDVQLSVLTVEHLRIVSEAFGRSAALKLSETAVAEALRQTSPLVHALRTRGALAASAKDIKKTVGFALSIREAILVKLSLFDDPDATWQSERLARLYGDLLENFDIRKRREALQEKVTFLSDLNLLLMELLQNRTSHRLEWIVIILIVIEVVLSVAHFAHS